MASLTGNLVAETYKALLKTIDNDILTASEKQITDGFGGGSNVFIDSQGFLRANKYKVTNGLATQFLKADGSLDTNTYLTSITGAQVITALGFTPVTNQRTLTINGVTYNLTANRTWTIEGTAAVWGNITGTLSNQTDLQNALNAKYNVPAGTITQYIRGDGSIANFPTLPGGLPIGGTAGQILSKIDATDYNAQWIDNFATQTKNEVKLGQTLTKGTAVYVSSANGTNMIVSAASNASEALSSKTFGLLETGGATNDLVKCVTFGLLAGLDTSAAQAGDPVWLGVNGALLFGLANKPVAPANMVYIGVVTRVQSNNGEIFVNIQNGFEIEELHDVLIQSKANNQGLFYESSTGLWKNKSITDVLGFVPQREDRLASSLFASATNYPNNNAVIAGLALKADAANPVFTGSMNIVGLESRINFYDENNLRKYFIGYDSGTLRIFQDTGSASRFYITPAGQTFIPGTLTVGSVVKDGGTASQFLKADGSIDSNTYVQSSALADYLLISTAASTYQRLDRMSINLLASDINYPNNNAVINALALKADAANPVFTGFMTISGAEPRLYFVDTDNNPDYTVFIDSGIFYIYDQTAGATRFSIGTTGNINAGIGKSITAGSFIKDGGTASQFLKADGSIDSNTYVASSALADYLLISTATATYQRLDRLASSLFASATNYPNNNAVIAGLALKADAANPMFTGSMNITGIESRINFYDQNNIRQFFIGYSSGNLSIFQDAGSATRFQINSSGNITTGINNTITSWGFVRSGGTSSQFLMADGSVSTFAGVTGSGTTNYIPRWTGSNALGNSIIFNNATSVGIGLTNPQSQLQINGDLTFSESGFDTVRLHQIAHGHSDGNSANNNLRFLVSNGAGNTAERMRLNGLGNLLINTTTDAGFRLDVNGSGRFSGDLRIEKSTPLFVLQASANDTLHGIEFRQGAGFDAFIKQLPQTGEFRISNGRGSGWGGFITLYTDSAERFRITPSGNVGIGTTAPMTFGGFTNLTIASSNTGSASAIFLVNSNTTIRGSWYNNFGSSINFGTATAHPLVFDTSDVERMRITSGGTLLVNATSANGYGGIAPKLEVYGTSVGSSDSDGGTLALLGNTNTADAGGALVLGGTTTSFYATWGRIRAPKDNATSGNYAGGLAFDTRQNSSNFSERMRLTSGGNVLIGTTTDGGNRLSVLGTIRSTQLRASEAGLGAGNYTIFSNDDNVGYIDTVRAVNSGDFQFRFTGTTRVTISTTGNVTATAFFESSDLRLKTLIKSNPIINGIEKLEAKLYEKNGKIELGYFAQDAELIMPYAVQKNDEGFLNLSYREIHTAKIARLEQRVAELEKQLNVN